MAQDDGLVLSLPSPACERLAAREPVPLGKLMRNLAVHLSARVRALSDELEATLEST